MARQEHIRQNEIAVERPERVDPGLAFIGIAERRGRVARSGPTYGVPMVRSAALR
jgi:hypothetical protein